MRRDSTVTGALAGLGHEQVHGSGRPSPLADCAVSTATCERMQKMDQQGHADVADASTSAGGATYPPGVSVYDADGEKLGVVSDRQDKDDFPIVHKGRLFGHDASIPRAAIDHSDGT